MKLIHVLIFTLLGFILLNHAMAAPDKEYWKFWDKSDESSKVVPSSSDWQHFLDRYVRFSDSTKMHMVLYGSVSREDYGQLQNYLSRMARVDPRSLPKKEQLAYWINLYNALTVDLILRNYPIKSITKLGKGWFRTGPWEDEVIVIQDKSLSLNDIEHRILRPLWNDPRIHYAINCASIGCPDLSPIVYRSGDIDYQLDEAGKRFINQTKGANFVGGRLMLSKIFEWYSADFGGSDGTWKELMKYAEPGLRKRLESYKGGISYHYNWKLNEYRR